MRCFSALAWEKFTGWAFRVKTRTGVTDALELIAGYKSGSITRAPRRVVVVGAGNTAIDAAIAAVRLGAESVTMVYRRGLDSISAFSFEYEHALVEGVRFEWFAQPLEIVGEERVEGVRLGRMQQHRRRDR